MYLLRPLPLIALASLKPLHTLNFALILAQTLTGLVKMEIPWPDGPHVTIFWSNLKCLPLRSRNETASGMVPCGINCEFNIEVARDDASIIATDYDGPRRDIGYTIEVNDIDVTRRNWGFVPTLAHVIQSPKSKFEQIRESIQQSETFKNLDGMLKQSKVSIQHSKTVKNINKILQQSKEKVDELFQEPKQNLDDMLSRVRNTITKVSLRKTSYGNIREVSKQITQTPRSDRTDNHGVSSPSRLKRQASMFLTTTKSISNNLRNFISNIFPRPATPDPVYYPIVTYDMPEEQMEGISRWVNNAHEGEEDPTNRDLFKVITTAQLLKMKGADMDTVERLRHYRVPPSTPVPQENREALAAALETDREEQLDGEEPYLEELEEEYEIPPKHKDLIKYLGLESNSLHIMKDPTHAYDDPANLSDYYKISVNCSDEDLLEELEDLKIPRWEGPEADPDYNPRDYDRPARTDWMQPPRTHKPSHSIILWLWSRGHSHHKIVQTIQLLDPSFLHDFSGHVWKGLFIPEYTEMTDGIIEKLRVLAPAPLHEWEVPGALDRHGKEFTDTYKDLRNQQCIDNLMKFTERVITNHFFYRIRRCYISYGDINIQHAGTTK